ncbi:hypothetical protein [Nocardioides sp.]|uniref:hypothetical protein n=1 Tax=Nocardioides sp. TaxID=35761 RepID=UPI0027327219|nr:hypothetical protein [Nocardioides sp.]MDP3892591.1 hypothetical protein [Nocardioides sp.]
MTANAAGAVMTIYLIEAGLSKLELLGPGAWFFLAVNLAKVPFSAGLDLISPESLVMDVLLVARHAGRRGGSRSRSSAGSASRASSWPR